MFNAFAPWSDPTITEINRLPMRSPISSSDSVDAARRSRAARRLRLDGMWRLKIFEKPEDVTVTVMRGSSSALGGSWYRVHVPGNWTLQDVGDYPHYTNIDMPFSGPPPRLPKKNPTGVYRKSFAVPRAWSGKQVVLHVGAADGVHLVYVNRKFVGYGTDNRLASEYDVSRYVRPGANELAIVVVRYSAHSYVEDQDQWWMAGLHRSVFVEARSEVHVRSVACTTDFDAGTGVGTADIEVDVTFTGSPSEGITAQLWFEEMSGKRVSEPLMVGIPHQSTERYVFPGHKAKVTVRVDNVRPWSAEDPHRYRLMVKLLGEVREYTSPSTD